MDGKVIRIYKESSIQEEWEREWSERTVQSEIAAKDSQYPEITSEIFSLLEKSNKILEAGCGLGRYLIPITGLGCDIYGVDYLKSVLVSVKDYMPEVRVAVSDIQFLPYPSNVFDLYISIGVLEHIPQGPEHGLEEARRVLQPGGILVITGPSIMTTFPARAFRVLLGWIPSMGRWVPHGIKLAGKEDEFFEYQYTASQISDFIVRAGFEILKCQYFGFREFVWRVPIFRSRSTWHLGKYRKLAILGMSQDALNIWGKIVEALGKLLFPAYCATGWIIVACNKDV